MNVTAWLNLAVSVAFGVFALWLIVPWPSRAAEVINQAVAADIEPPRWALRTYRVDQVTHVVQVGFGWATFWAALAGVTDGVLNLFGAVG